MSTRVVHGPAPDFGVPLQAGTYHATVTGHYTTQDGVAAAGVSEVVWGSDRAIKRRAELLALRSAFIGFFCETWLELGGTWAEAQAAIQQYPFPKIRAQLDRHADANVRKWRRKPTKRQLAKWARREGVETPVNKAP